METNTKTAKNKDTIDFPTLKVDEAMHREAFQKGRLYLLQEQLRGLQSMLTTYHDPCIA